MIRLFLRRENLSLDPRYLFRTALLVALALACVSCSSREKAGDDPLEGWNRAVFAFNVRVDRYALRPVTYGYRTIIPEQVRLSVNNFFLNLEEPVNALNAGLQGDAKGVEISLGRFITNTVIGIGGLFDVAQEAGLYQETRTFGETLAAADFPPGDYLVLPLFGSTNARHSIGLIFDSLVSPHEYFLIRMVGDPDAWRISENIARIISARDRNFENIDGFFANSLDPYVAARSAFLQRYKDAPEEDTHLDFSFDDEW